MNSQEKSVATVDELVAATKDTGAHHIVVRGVLGRCALHPPCARTVPAGRWRRGSDHLRRRDRWSSIVVRQPGPQYRASRLGEQARDLQRYLRRKPRADRIAQRHDDWLRSDSGARQGARRPCRRERPRHHRGRRARRERPAARLRRLRHQRRVHALEHAVRRQRGRQRRPRRPLGRPRRRAGSRQRHFRQRRRRQGRAAQCAAPGDRCRLQRWRDCARHGGPDHRRRLHGLWRLCRRRAGIAARS